jgi:hypothetical protein
MGLQAYRDRFPSAVGRARDAVKAGPAATNWRRMRITERWQRGDFGDTGGLYTAGTDLLEYLRAENEKDRRHELGRSPTTPNAR